jgi:N-acetylglucosamine-6-phosphate deacetylase
MRPTSILQNSLARTSGYVDLQINGLLGVDFNAPSLDREAMERACAGLLADGTTHFLPTVITDSMPALQTKLIGLAAWCHEFQKHTETSGATPVGIHLEGPFLSRLPGFIGAHPRQHARMAELDLTKQLFEWGDGQIRMVTLAPECDPSCATIRWLADQGILVAAGHTDASLDTLKRALDAGLTLFTHLGNGCPAQMHRHDNIVHRVLRLRNRLCVTLIADGHHLPVWLLASWLEQFGEDRVAIVSDAISAAGLAAGEYQLGDRRVAVGTDGVPRSEDGTHYIGSGATLGKMDRLLQTELPLEPRVRTKLFRENAWRWLE